jgi:hypothetical protein
MKLMASASKGQEAQLPRIVCAIAVAAAAAGCAGQPPAAAPSSPSTAAPPSPSTTAGATKAAYPTMAPLEQYLIADRDAEIAMARSAAPPKISNDATVYVLTRRGYEKVAEGKNGFVCYVERSWMADFDDPEFWNPKGRAPACLNAQAASSVLPIQFKRTELVLAGLGREQILERIKDAIAKKEFGAPAIGAMSYMMSKQQILSYDDHPHWHPHLMFYMPGEMNASAWGANLASGSAVYGGGVDLPGGGRLPAIIFFVPVPLWSDGTPAETHEHS